MEAQDLKNKWSVIVVVFTIFALLAVLLFKQKNIERSKEAFGFKIDSVQTNIDNIGVRLIDSVISSTVDSTLITDAIKKSIDERFRYSDAIFIYENNVIVDSRDSIIGKMIIYTNKDAINKTYDTIEKGRLYESLMDGKLRIKQDTSRTQQDTMRTQKDTIR